jgi:hypothetical protein
MVTGLTIAAIVFGLALLVLEHGQAVLHRLRIKPKPRIRIHQKAGQPSIEGTLISQRRGVFLLEDAELLQQVDATLELPGQVRVPRENIAFYQVLNAS